MELLTLEPRPNPYPLRRPDALEVAAWRPPTTARFDGRVANDLDVLRAAPPMEAARPQEPVTAPAWAVAVAGGVIAACLGVMAGAALAL